MCFPGHTSLPKLETTTRTLGFISICATAASASVYEACNVMTKLTLAASGGVATRQIREYIQNLQAVSWSLCYVQTWNIAHELTPPAEVHGEGTIKEATHTRDPCCDDRWEHQSMRNELGASSLRPLR